MRHLNECVAYRNELLSLQVHTRQINMVQFHVVGLQEPEQLVQERLRILVGLGVEVILGFTVKSKSVVAKIEGSDTLLTA
jgi:hypothetical protein